MCNFAVKKYWEVSNRCWVWWTSNMHQNRFDLVVASQTWYNKHNCSHSLWEASEGLCPYCRQWVNFHCWNLTKYIYLSTELKYNIEMTVLCVSISIRFCFIVIFGIVACGYCPHKDFIGHLFRLHVTRQTFIYYFIYFLVTSSGWMT